MAGTSLLALLDDIASMLDDVAVLTKVATKKTAGVLGDDLALNAEQVAGVSADRELPVVWAVAKGSVVNKLILVPAALAISAVAPFAVTPLLMLGGAFLCFEGVEKLAHKLVSDKRQVAAHKSELKAALRDPAVDLVAFEAQKIKGAIRTDFVLSAEIVAIALSTVAAAPFGTRLAVLASLAALMTVGVYGLVAGIVKLDDFGLHLTRRGPGARRVGFAILWLAPHVMKALSVVGTAAMFLVGGGILTHGLPFAHHLSQQLSERAAAVPHTSGLLGAIVPLLVDLGVGIAAGSVLVAFVTLGKRLRAKQTSAVG